MNRHGDPQPISPLHNHWLDRHSPWLRPLDLRIFPGRIQFAPELALLFPAVDRRLSAQLAVRNGTVPHPRDLTSYILRANKDFARRRRRALSYCAEKGPNKKHHSPIGKQRRHSRLPIQIANRNSRDFRISRYRIYWRAW